MGIYAMTTHFITAEIDLNADGVDLQANIEAKLRQQGEPLRWAITAVEEDTAQIEAVVVKASKTAPSS